MVETEYIEIKENQPYIKRAICDVCKKPLYRVYTGPYSIDASKQPKPEAVPVCYYSVESTTVHGGEICCEDCLTTICNDFNKEIKGKRSTDMMKIKHHYRLSLPLGENE